jgi:hypothetical protein
MSFDSCAATGSFRGFSGFYSLTTCAIVDRDELLLEKRATGDRASELLLQQEKAILAEMREVADAARGSADVVDDRGLSGQVT